MTDHQVRPNVCIHTDPNHPQAPSAMETIDRYECRSKYSGLPSCGRSGIMAAFVTVDGVWQDDMLCDSCLMGAIIALDEFEVPSELLKEARER